MASKFSQIDFGTPIDFSAFTFSNPRKNPSGGSSVTIQINGKTPLLECPPFYVFPPSIPEGAKVPKLTAKLPSEKYKTEQTDQFRRNMESFTNTLIEEAIKQGRGAWVPGRVQKLTPESVVAVMNPLIKVPEDPNKCPLFNCKFDGWDTITTEIFDAQMNVVPVDGPMDVILPMGTIVKLKVVPKVWINPNGFGVTFTIKKIKKEPVTGGLPRGVWDIEAEPAEVSKSFFEKPIHAEAPKAADCLQVADSDEEEDTMDPDSEYASSAAVASTDESSEPPPPKKGRTKVTKKN